MPPLRKRGASTEDKNKNRHRSTERTGFRCLEGKRVGLITNPTGVDNRMKSTIDILHEAPNVNLVALYGPEHGVRGDVHAGDHVTDIKDATTGVARLFALREDPQSHAGHAERRGCIGI